MQVTVEDSGPGLDPNTMAKIFEPFYTTKSTGMGMGLSISRSIVQSHGGRLWATAKDGPGTSFHFTLPKCQENEIMQELRPSDAMMAILQSTRTRSNAISSIVPRSFRLEDASVSLLSAGLVLARSHWIRRSTSASSGEGRRGGIGLRYTPR